MTIIPITKTSTVSTSDEHGVFEVQIKQFKSPLAREYADHYYDLTNHQGSEDIISLLYILHQLFNPKLNAKKMINMFLANEELSKYIHEADYKSSTIYVGRLLLNKEVL